MSALRDNLLDLDSQRLGQWFEAHGHRSFRATQLVKWVHQQGTVDLDGMTNLSKALRDELRESTELRLPEVKLEQRSKDGTIKWLLDVGADNAVETVFIPEPDRGTLCVSSQVGCPLACVFCATGLQGFNRNLRTSEIIGQLWLARNRLGEIESPPRRISNIVMMGMGEPTMNLDNVIPALNLMLDDNAYGLARKRVTVSTAGHVPGIDRLAKECPVSLAVSLHAPDDDLRNELVPLNKSFPIRDLMDACRRYGDIDRRGSITFEYILLAGVNDSAAEAKALVKCLRGVPAKVNLIPYNPVPGLPYARPTEASIVAFRQHLIDAGLITITRRTRGDDIDAACGQLAGKVLARAQRNQRLAAAC